MRLIVSDSSCLIDLRKASLLKAFLDLPYEVLIPDALFEEDSSDSRPPSLSACAASSPLIIPPLIASTWTKSMRVDHQCATRNRRRNAGMVQGRPPLH